MLSKSQRYLMAVLSGILLSLPWYQSFSGLFLLIAFVPLILLENHYYQSRKTHSSTGLLYYAAFSFFIWNGLTTWWIYNASLFAVIAAVVINTSLFSIVFWIFHLTKRSIGEVLGNIAFVIYWIAFEYFYLNAEISWPWLTLGNGFAHSVSLIQWYEFTGVLGGTLWVLLMNVLITGIVIHYIQHRNFSAIRNRVFAGAVLLIIPVIISVIRYYSYTEVKNPYAVVVTQPNINPYEDRRTGISAEEKLNIDILQAALFSTPKVDYFIGPETAIQENIWESELNQNWYIGKVRSFLKFFPKAKFVIGAETVKEYKPGEVHSSTAQKFRNSEVWYDSYNTALQIDSTRNIQIYHKSKLVVGVEKMPYVRYLHFLEPLAEKLGGSLGSLGTQDSRSTFVSPDNRCRVAPVICYESVYGEYVNAYVKNGANFIFVITNDGWWGNTPGHFQHFSYSRLRAIETRRSVARSANTGISAFINQRGDVLQSLQWKERGALMEDLNANDKITFYVRYGDYIGRIAEILSLLIIMYSLFQYSLKRFRKTTHN